MRLHRDILVLVALWLGTALAAFLLGRGFAPSPAAEVDSGSRLAGVPAASRVPASPVRSHTEPDFPPEAAPHRPSPTDSLVEDDRLADPAALAPRQVEMDAWEVVHRSDLDAASQWAAFTAVLGSLNADNIAYIVELFDVEEPTPDQRRQRQILLAEWGRMDGPGAMTYALGLEDGRDTQRAAFHIMTGWAGEDSEGAMAWANANQDAGGIHDSNFLPGIVNGLAVTDLELATDVLLQSTRHHNARSVELLVAAHARQGPDVLIQWADELPPGPVRNEAVTRVADRLGRTDPVGNQDWLMSLPTEQEQRAALGPYLRGWSRQQPLDAADWVANLPEGDLQIEGINTMLRRLGREDPEIAAVWVSQFPPARELDRSLSEIANRSLQRNPEQALGLAFQISDERIRNRQVQNLSRRWLQTDPAAANAFFGN